MKKTTYQSIVAVFVVLFLVFAACEVEEVKIKNEGKVCIQGSQSVKTIESGSPLLVTVHLDDCLSSSCTTDRKAKCTVAIIGKRVEVTSRFSYTDEIWRNMCSLDCLDLYAECETESIIDEGNYQVFLGEKTLGDIQIPYKSFELCFYEIGD